MKPDDKTERTKPVEDRDENASIEREHESEATQEPQPTGWAAQLRQIMHRSAQGEATKTRVSNASLSLRRRKFRSHNLRDGLRNCVKSCTVRRRVKPEPTSSVSNSKRIAPKAFSCLPASQLCWRWRFS